MHYLYKISNLANDKVYIGQTINPTTRFSMHKSHAKTRGHLPLYKAFSKYGIESFTYQVIACCKTLEDADYTEVLLIQQYDSLVQNGKGYNIEDGGYGHITSDATKKKMSEIAKQAYANGRISPMLGKKASDETRKKQSLSKQGKPSPKKGIPSGHAPWNKGLIGTNNPQTGSKRSPETKELLRQKALIREQRKRDAKNQVNLS